MHSHLRGTHILLEIDVHKDESHVAVLDSDGEIDREIRVENANLDEVVQQYEGSQAAIEALQQNLAVPDRAYCVVQYRRFHRTYISEAIN